MAPRIEPADVERLTKLLALTASDHDGEALAAVRRANAVLARLNLHWTEVFEAVGDIRPLSASETINAALDFVLTTTAPSSFRDFILNMQSQWAAKGSLSPKQIRALLDAEDRQRRWVQERASG